MDSVDILAKEEEFKKLNKQLEKKTESLIKQIENAMQKQDIFSEFSHSLSTPVHTPSRKHCCETPKSSTHSTPVKNNLVKNNLVKKRDVVKVSSKQEMKDINCTQDEVKDTTNKVICQCCCIDNRNERMYGDMEFLYAFVSVSVQEKVLPQTFLKDKPTVESVCKFLSSKVRLMQEQIDKLQNTINKKAAQCEVHLSHQAELESERMALLNRSNNHQAMAADMKAKYLAVQKKLEEKDRLYKEQRSETDRLSSELKRARCKITSLDARCAFLDNNVDNLKQQLEAAKVTEKDYRESTRHLTTNHSGAISKLESRIKCLTSRLNKLDKLVHNLKQQRALLMADGAVKVLEKEFNAFLLKDF